MATADTLRRLHARFRASTMPVKLIIVNIVLFVAMRLAAIAGLFSSDPDIVATILSFVQLPSSLPMLLSRPWTLISYMFAQYDLLHLLFNLLWLYWFGIILSAITPPRRLLALYLLGGLGGALLFLLSYNLLPYFAHHIGMLIGSSAAVMAIVTASAILMPDFRMNLLFIGPVKLKWIAIASIALVILGVSGSNAGGEIAHIGGILTGTVYALNLKKGRDITTPIVKIFDVMTSIKIKKAPKYTPKTEYSRPSSSARHSASEPDDNDRAELDSILDKIKKSGYAGLTAEERKRLFDISRNIK